MLATSTPYRPPTTQSVVLPSHAFLRDWLQCMQSFNIGEDIYGPFEAGFTSKQDNIISGLGCSVPSDGYLPGGIDTRTAQDVVMKNCSVVLPRWETGTWVGLIDSCGGHTGDYHFHEELKCLWEGAYNATDIYHHSSQIGEVANVGFDTQYLYGKYENEVTEVAPLLDTCGGHFGITPDSNGESVYHYHIQDAPPFSIGCIGPSATGGMVSLSECRDVDSSCGDGDTITLVTDRYGKFEYDLFCPCYDGNGSNVGPPSENEATSSPSASPTPGTTTQDASSTTSVIIGASVGGVVFIIIVIVLIVVVLRANRDTQKHPLPAPGNPVDFDATFETPQNVYSE